MSTPLKAYVYPADAFGCGHYRLVWPAEIVDREEGWETVIAPPGQRTGVQGRIMHDPLDPHDEGTLQDVSWPEDADVLVFQRPTNHRLADAIEQMTGRGMAVVVDMDDDLALIDPLNPAFGRLHPKQSPDDNWTHAARACAAATMVTVSTPAIAERYGAHGRVAVMPNCVPAGFLAWPREDEAEDTPTVGWPGSTHSHPRDLQIAAPALRRSGLPFRVVGPPNGVSRALGVPEEDVEATGSVPFNEWSKVVSTLEVGIAPLADTRFNRAKSWLKPLEMSACGVPWVASNATEYQRLHDVTGAGLIVDRSREWDRALRKLRDPAYREEQSERGRDGAAQFTYQAHGWRWAEVWEQAVRMAGAARRSVLAPSLRLP